MDSKSISRKGVGVQVPASAPTAPDELARALVPVLLHKLNNTTQYLSALQALAADPVEALHTSAVSGTHPGAFEGLSVTAREVDDLGWILGLVANAGGADVLLERRERSGLTPLVQLVAECLRRNRRDLENPSRALPDLDVRAGEAAWRVPWAAARWLYGAGMSAPIGTTLAWQLVEHGSARLSLACRTFDVASMRDLAAALHAFDPRLETRVDDGESVLVLPGSSSSSPVRAVPPGRPS